MIKPYVDVDLKIAADDFEAEKQRVLGAWMQALRKVCKDVAVASRHIPDIGEGKSKISFHIHLNGLKCRADRVGTYMQQFSHLHARVRVIPHPRAGGRALRRSYMLHRPCNVVIYEEGDAPREVRGRLP